MRWPKKPKLEKRITVPNIAKWHTGELATLWGQQYIVTKVSCNMAFFHILSTERQLTLSRLTGRPPEDFIP